MAGILQDRAAWKVVCFAAVLVVLAMGCMSGSGPSNANESTGPNANESTGPNANDTEGPSEGTETPEPSPLRLASGTVAVYFMSYTGSGTSYETVGGQTLVIESSGGGVFCYLEDRKDAILVEEFYSPDYARNEIHPYTVDGRLFLVQVFPDSSHAEFSEFDPRTSERSTGWLAYVDTNSDYTSWSDYGIVGDRLYYRTAREWDVFGGYSGGYLYTNDLDPKAEKKFLLGYTDPDNFGNLHAAGNRLFRVRRDADLGLVEITSVDPADGSVKKHMKLAIEDDSEHEYWSFAVDQDAFYIAALHTESSTVRLWRMPWLEVPIKGWDGVLRTFSFVEDDGPGSESPVYVASEFWDSGPVISHPMADERDTLQGIDADDGYVVLDLFCWGEATILLYNHGTGVTRLLHPDLEGSYAQVLRVR